MTIRPPPPFSTKEVVEISPTQIWIRWLGATTLACTCFGTFLGRKQTLQTKQQNNGAGEGSTRKGKSKRKSQELEQQKAKQVHKTLKGMHLFWFCFLFSSDVFSFASCFWFRLFVHICKGYVPCREGWRKRNCDPKVHFYDPLGICEVVPCPPTVPGCCFEQV